MNNKNMKNLPSHLQFNINDILDIIHAKEIWRKYPNLLRLDNIDLQDENKKFKKWQQLD